MIKKSTIVENRLRSFSVPNFLAALIILSGLLGLGAALYLRRLLNLV